MTSEQLIAAVARRCFWPSSNAPLSDSDILAIATEELVGDAYPLVMASHGDYYLVRKDYTVVASQRLYRLPPRSYGSIKDVCWVDTQGIEYALPIIAIEDLARVQYLGQTGDVRSASHYIEGDQIGLYPVPTTALGTLRVKYYLQPSALVLSTSTSVAPLTGQFAYTGVYPGYDVVAWTSGQLAPDNKTLDVVSGGNAHATIVTDVAVTASIIVGDVSQFTWPDDPQIVAGDYFTLPGYSPLVQLPDFMLPYFVRRVAAGCLIAAGDRPGAAGELQEASKLYEKAQGQLSPRNESEPRIVRSRNSALSVRGGGFTWGR